jgi:hypothetical protein
MASLAISLDTLEEIRTALGLPSFSRPWAVVIDPGDFGTVFTYLPLASDEYQRLPPALQKHAYRIDAGRFGLVGFVPKVFEIPREGLLTGISVTYNPYGKIVRLGYITDQGSQEFRVEHPLRQEMLLAYAKKKKLPQKMKVSSS